MPLLPEPQPRHRPRHRAKSHPVRLLTAGATLGALVVSVSLAAPAIAPGQRDVGDEPAQPGPALVRLTQSPLFHAPRPAVSPKRATPALGHRLRVNAPQRPAQSAPELAGLVVSVPEATSPAPSTPSPTDTLPNLHRLRVPATSTPSPTTTVVAVPVATPTSSPVPTTSAPSPTGSAPPRRLPSPTTTSEPEPTETRPVATPTQTPTATATTTCPEPEPTHRHRHRKRHPH